MGVLILRSSGGGGGGSTFDYYIGPSGDDNNPGTLVSPWSITALNSKRATYAGKSIGLLDGTYDRGRVGGVETYIYDLVNGNTSQQFVALGIQGGTGGSPTILQAVNARQALITAYKTGARPNDGTTAGAGFIGQGSNGTPAVTVGGNVVIDGIEVTGGYGSGIHFYPPNGTSPGGPTGAVVQNCVIHDIGGDQNGNMGGVFGYACTGLNVINCKIYDVVPTHGTLSGQNCAGIFTEECLDNVYEYNTIYACNTGIYDKNTTTGSTYRYNYVEITTASGAIYPNWGMLDCAGGATGTTSTWHNNILISKEGSYWGANAILGIPVHQSIDFYNNTCWFGGGTFGSGGVFAPTAGTGVSPSGQVTFYNNIVGCTSTSPSNGLICFNRNSSAVLLSDYNTFQTSSTSFVGVSTGSYPSSLETLASWQAAVSQDANSQRVATGTLFSSAAILTPTDYQSLPVGVAATGRVGGTSGGAAIDPGAWGGASTPTRIGCDF